MDMSSSGLIWAVVLPISREFLYQHVYSAQIIKLQKILLGNIYLIILHHIFSDMFWFSLSHDHGATIQGITQYI